MSDEWFVINVLIPTAGGIGPFLTNGCTPELLAYARKRPTLSTLSDYVIGLILSHTRLEYTLPIMCTCKQWYNESRKSTFWKARIVKKLMSIRTDFGIAVYSGFNTFQSPVKETLREQVEWVFRDKSWVLFEYSVPEDDYIISRKTHLNTCYEEWLEKTRHTFITRKWMILQAGKSVSYNFATEMVVQHLNGDYFKINSFNSPIAKELIRFYPNGDKFEGSGLLIGNIYEAHGNGKWTFADGTILEGEMIACRGKPRFIDTEPLIKRAKITL